ncbi:selenocysteine insertion sequence-binding protein 2 [Thrips palmi]|uniref:Selenocysteine insertion sequence-binding protein 2 n=1 Tax=Thrips palmi TaxID=161013 RepID=A0A6P8ZIP7_THRPL|nr:selenocysteine insertion sequence-binding protein 2 [Thrips palmi]
MERKETSNGQPSSANASATMDFGRNEVASHPQNLNSDVSSNILHSTNINECVNSLIDCTSCPNEVEGQRLCVIKDGTTKSFAQKVQGQSSGGRTLTFLKVKVPGNQKDAGAGTLQKLSASHPLHNQSESSERSLITGKNHKKMKNLRRIQPQDSRISVIDGSKKEEWLQSEPMKQSVSCKSSALLEEDFPDLAVAFKALPKCTVRYEFDTPAQIGEKCDDTSLQLCHVTTSSGRKFKKKQPRRRDPISVNIIDIIKKTDSCIRISPKNLRKIKNKDHERKTLGANYLDSSNPVRKRGKHREAGPRKKMSKLKHIILNERIKKQEQRGGQVKEISLEPDEKEKPSVTSVCDGIVSLSIDQCSQLLKASDCSHTRGEISDFVNSALSNNSGPPEVANTVPAKFQLNNIPLGFHSRKFRDYCDNMRSKALDEAVTNLLKTIHGFQDRHYQKDPIRAHAKRRFVLGIREVKKYLMLKKLKFIVIAPDLEPVKSPGGLDETVIQIREEGRTQQIPVVFAVGRRQLGFALMRKVPISIVGIISPEGAEELYREVLTQWHIAIDSYQKKVSELCCSSEIK